MADNSAFITGVADGAFEDAFGDLPPWATEDTLETIEGILSSTLDFQKKSFTALMKSLQAANSGTAGSSTDAQKSMQDFINELDEANAKQKKSRKLDDDEEKKKKLRRARAESVGLAFDALIVKTGELIKKAFSDNFITFNSLTKAGINAINGFDQLGDASVDVKTGFEAVQQLTVLSGVRFTELSKATETLR